MNKEKIIQAGKISIQVKDYAREIIKSGMPLLEIAEKIEDKIFELGGKPAFPTNLSINEIAAHYTPSYNDEKLANGLLKIDLGVHIDGWISDTAFSLDLDNNEENKKLINSSKKALEKAQKKINKNVLVNEIGYEIEKSIKSDGFIPIRNLTGHQIDNYELHTGLSIPNFDNNKKDVITKGIYAIEPFVTIKNGSGKVYDGKPSGIYILEGNHNPRDSFSRKILEYIQKEYKTLPFCSRWIIKKFGIKSIIYLKQLERNKNIYQFNELIESSHSKVAQTENTMIIGDEKIITSS
jgi:methionyl aminopeptidase